MFRLEKEIKVLRDHLGNKIKYPLVLGPGESIRIKMKISGIPLLSSTSTFARMGIIAQISSRGMAGIVKDIGKRGFKRKREVEVQIINMGNRDVRVERPIRIRLLDMEKLGERIGEIPLKYYGKYLKGSEEVGKERIALSPGKYIVVSSQPVKVPRDAVGIVLEWKEGLQHISTRFVHPGFEGRLALEFYPLGKLVKIRKGEVVAKLVLFKKEIPTLFRRRQRTIVPKKL